MKTYHLILLSTASAFLLSCGGSANNANNGRAANASPNTTIGTVAGSTNSNGTVAAPQNTASAPVNGNPASNASAAPNKAVPLGTPAKANVSGDKPSKGSANTTKGTSGSPTMQGPPPPMMQGPPMMKSTKPLGGKIPAPANTPQ